MSDDAIPSSLQSPDLGPVWQMARERLDRHGPAHRGRVQLPPDLSSRASLVLASLLGRQLGRQIDLNELEAGLARLGVSDNLDGALRALGHPPSATAQRRRHDRLKLAGVRQAVQEEVATWPEPWAGDWAAEVIGGGTLAGLSAQGAVDVVARVRRLLDVVADPAQRPPLILDRTGLASRTDLAAALFGSAHALDSNERLERAASRALARAARQGARPRVHGEGDANPGCDLDRGAGGGWGVDGAAWEADALWEQAGYHRDRVSSPVLTWGLEVAVPSPVATITAAATAGGVPVHLSIAALAAHPVRVPAGAVVLVVENPRLVEAASEIGIDHAVVATNGNPTRAATLLVTQLVASGAEVRYHGDFDSAGIGICRRMADLGCVPWRMSATDYLAAADRAEAAGVKLPAEASPCGPTPWDPALEAAIAERGQIIHEELVVDELLGHNAPRHQRWDSSHGVTGAPPWRA